MEKGLEQGERSLTLRQLHCKFGELPDRALTQINALSGPQLATLGEALLEFGAIADLQAWLDNPA